MSAFIVENKHIENILHGVIIAGYSHDKTMNKVKMTYDGAEYTFAELAKTLLELNAKAVNQRYSNTETPQEFEFSNNMQMLMTSGDVRVPTQCKPIDAYKSLECFLYQCSEGDSIMKSNLFKEVVDFKASLASKIIRALPEYESAKW